MTVDSTNQEEIEINKIRNENSVKGSLSKLLKVEKLLRVVKIRALCKNWGAS